MNSHIIHLTPDQLKDQCPEGYADLERQNRLDPSLTPIDKLTIWKTASGDFYVQDPADAGFGNVALVWDGDCWG